MWRCLSHVLVALFLTVLDSQHLLRAQATNLAIMVYITTQDPLASPVYVPFQGQLLTTAFQNQLAGRSLATNAPNTFACFGNTPPFVVPNAATSQPFAGVLSAFAPTDVSGTLLFVVGIGSECGARHVDRRRSANGLSAPHKAIAGSGARTAANSSTSAAPVCLTVCSIRAMSSPSWCSGGCATS